MIVLYGSPITRAHRVMWMLEEIGLRIGISKAHFTPLDVHDVDSRGEIRDLDGRPGPVSGNGGQF